MQLRYGGGTVEYGYNALGQRTSLTYPNSSSVSYGYDLGGQLQTVTQGSTTTSYLYGAERLAATSGSTRTWYATDALGSVRQTVDDSGTPLGGANYDPWGQVESSSLTSPFGFTGELQQGGSVYLRARWYNAANGAFTARDPFAGTPEQPYSLPPYQYGYSDPVVNTDPAGTCVIIDDEDCHRPPLHSPMSGNSQPIPPIPSQDRNRFHQPRQ